MQNMTTSLERTITVSFEHRIFFTRSVFSGDNPLLAQLINPNRSGNAAKVLIVVDQGVAKTFPKLVEQITSYFEREIFHARLVCPPILVTGGEAAKNSRELVDELHRQIEQHGIDRHSYLIAVGGGALRWRRRRQKRDQRLR
jgi:3-dehydroquinate synthase